MHVSLPMNTLAWNRGDIPGLPPTLFGHSADRRSPVFRRDLRTAEVARTCRVFFALPDGVGRQSAPTPWPQRPAALAAGAGSRWPRLRSDGRSGGRGRSRPSPRRRRRGRSIDPGSGSARTWGCAAIRRLARTWASGRRRFRRLARNILGQKANPRWGRTKMGASDRSDRRAVRSGGAIAHARCPKAHCALQAE